MPSVAFSKTNALGTGVKILNLPIPRQVGLLAFFFKPVS